MEHLSFKKETVSARMVLPSGEKREDATRYVGKTGDWEWVAAFAPEGFYEIWGILPGVTSLRTPDDSI